ncbi:hypothetical protein HELRODRAFT_83268, partial [Helobdella robusta]|uniref:Uncharacterized protein n=1 Tax=Helobdella robusta TaxID=6412 RepID=T1G531_HELRO
GWTRILSVMHLPELDHREFVHESLINGCYFTLHALALIKLSQCQSTADEVHILMSLNDWNTSANPNQSNEGKLFLFWNKILELCTRQLRNNNKSLVTSTLVQTTGCLITLGEDKSGLGLFGVIGLGKKSNFSLRFRVVANAMAAFIASMLCRDASLQQSTTSQAASQLNQQTTTRLKNMLADKQYINYKQQIQLACQFIVDNHLSIFDFKYVFWSVVKPLFSDIYYLGVLKCEM